MSFLEVLCEGESDKIIIEAILRRKFKLAEGEDFRVHPHQGKGSLPANPRKAPESHRRGLLDQLPAKLRGYARSRNAEYEPTVIILVDSDNEDCRKLKRSLVGLLKSIRPVPPVVLVRIAVEELESWFIADLTAMRLAFGRPDLAELRKIQPDALCGAWEALARSIGRNPEDCSGGDKIEWSKLIADHLNVENPNSPSLRAFISGLDRHIHGKGGSDAP